MHDCDLLVYEDHVVQVVNWPWMKATEQSMIQLIVISVTANSNW